MYKTVWMRLLAMLLTMLLLIGMLGCGGAPAAEPAAAEPAATEPAETAAPAPTATIEPDLPDETATEENAIDIEDIVVMDDERMCVTVQKLYPDEPEGYGVSVEIENRTEDTWSVALARAAVNGLMIPTESGCEVIGGEKRTHSFVIPKDELASYGMADVTDLVLTFGMSNSSAQPTLDVSENAFDMPVLSSTDANALLDWFLNSNFQCGPVHICPYGEEKVSLYVREPQEDDRLLYESDAARVTMFGGAFDAEGGYSVQFYLENLNPLAEEAAQRRTDLIYSVFNPKINGVQVVNNIVNVNVEQRSTAYLTAAWTAAELSAAGIGKIKNLEVLLDIRDTETGAVYTNETIKILP